mmetsp:Transcript_17464/g.39575  ORF Transcript_17464/g.39575 Transcript_17464/m.39575 type:complete len:208 (-) Transcript_17464:1029-1652(-)
MASTRRETKSTASPPTTGATPSAASSTGGRRVGRRSAGSWPAFRRRAGPSRGTRCSIRRRTPRHPTSATPPGRCLTGAGTSGCLSRASAARSSTRSAWTARRSRTSCGRASRRATRRRRTSTAAGRPARWPMTRRRPGRWSGWRRPARGWTTPTTSTTRPTPAPSRSQGTRRQAPRSSLRTTCSPRAQWPWARRRERAGAALPRRPR